MVVVCNADKADIRSERRLGLLLDPEPAF
jgi:hypothetical protein